jgi:hypothetical protein
VDIVFLLVPVPLLFTLVKVGSHLSPQFIFSPFSLSARQSSSMRHSTPGLCSISAHKKKQYKRDKEQNMNEIQVYSYKAEREEENECVIIHEIARTSWLMQSDETRATKNLTVAV